MSVKETVALALLAPEDTKGSITGSYVDIQGIIGDRRELKAILQAGPGTGPGPVSCRVESAADTAGTGLATRIQFAQMTSAGGFSEGHANIGTHRYVRLIGATASTQDMLVAASIIGVERFA